MSGTTTEFIGNMQGSIVFVILALEAIVFLCIGVASHNRKYRKSMEQKKEKESSPGNYDSASKALAVEVALGDSPRTPDTTYASESSELDFALDDSDVDDVEFVTSNATLQSMNLVTRVPVCLSPILERVDED